MLGHWYTLLLARLGIGPAPREVVEFDSPIATGIEFDSPIAAVVEFDSRINLEVPPS